MSNPTTVNVKNAWIVDSTHIMYIQHTYVKKLL